MKHCSLCQMDVLGQLEKCPLCQAPLTGEGEYPQYPKYIKSLRERLFVRLFFYLSMLTMGICFFCNYYFTPQFFWSLIVLGGVLYSWVIYFHHIQQKRNLSRYGLIHTLCLSGLILCVDVGTGFSKWSTGYVIPFLIDMGALCCIILIILSPKKFFDYTVNLLILQILGVCCYFFQLLNLADVRWPAFLAMGVSAGIFLLLLVFFRSHLIAELKRRLHF